MPAGAYRLFRAVRRAFRRFETARSESDTHHQAEWTLHFHLEPDEDDGGYVIECIELPGCMSQGETREEAIANLKDAIVEVLTVRVREQLQPTDSLDDDGEDSITIAIGA